MRIISVFTVCLLMTISIFAKAKPYIEIEGARFRALNVALPNIVVAQGSVLKKDIASKMQKIIRNDLDLSGVFRIINPKSYLVNPKKEPFALEQIKSQSWKAVGAEALIKVKISLKPNALFADVLVVNLGDLTKTKNFSYFVGKSEYVGLAHKIAGDVYQLFTNESDIFTSNIVAAKQAGNSKNKKIVSIDYDGKNQRTITNDSAYSLLPSIAPDGKSVLFNQYAKNNLNLYEYYVKTGKVKPLSKRVGLNLGGRVSPDNKRIILTLSGDKKSDIYLLNRQGKKLKRLTSSWGINTSPSFSPDGKKVAFVSSRSGNPQLYIMNIDGFNQKRVTFQGKYNQTPVWSSKGDVIAFTARDERKKFDIFLLHLASMRITRVTQDEGDNEDPSFSPNGRMLVFSSTRTGKRELFISNLDGSFQRQITKGGNYYTPSWGPKLNG